MFEEHERMLSDPFYNYIIDESIYESVSGPLSPLPLLETDFELIFHDLFNHAIPSCTNYNFPKISTARNIHVSHRKYVYLMQSQIVMLN